MFTINKRNWTLPLDHFEDFMYLQGVLNYKSVTLCISLNVYKSTLNKDRMRIVSCNKCF